MNLSERFLEHRLIFHLGNPFQDVMNSSQIQIQNQLNINWKIYSLLSSLPSRLGQAQHSLSSPSFSFPAPAQQAAGAQPNPPLLAPPAHSLGLGHASLRPKARRSPAPTPPPLGRCELACAQHQAPCPRLTPHPRSMRAVWAGSVDPENHRRS